MNPSPPTSHAADSFDALLIVGHGTRDSAGLGEFHELVERVARQRPDWRVRGCFLELAEPSIATAVDALAAAGLTRLRALPLVLFSAGHAKRDIPAELGRAIARNSGLTIELCPHLGCHPEIVALSDQHCRAAIVAAGGETVSPDETLLILVGRGSSDPDAVAEMRRFADLRRGGYSSSRATNREAAQPIADDVEVAFVAVAAPLLGDALKHARQSRFRRVIVQPHLLFAGEVLTEVAGQVEACRQSDADSAIEREWIVPQALGPDGRLVTAVVDIASSATPIRTAK
ncbi:MAG TPA: CbiX/SirB N-terminal domain-containing protein [Pirellulales bacterium]|nr:CbiX/SirB N-terminal domain-containing protein [Pirellulales bacterium]